MASEEVSLAAPVSLRDEQGVGGSQDPQCENHYLAVCVGGGVEERQGLLLPQGSS